MEQNNTNQGRKQGGAGTKINRKTGTVTINQAQQIQQTKSKQKKKNKKQNQQQQQQQPGQQQKKTIKMKGQPVNIGENQEEGWQCLVCRMRNPETYGYCDRCDSLRGLTKEEAMAEDQKEIEEKNKQIQEQLNNFIINEEKRKKEEEKQI
ncbi:hypothetical protein PPERSA_06981 [Pseudocohnilembus persalinus]|uniref:RanBP2-type domain-containing protein n=1 Tax=Pseudocohnilembus persalinus TaxID=266149 RepID=A0A0V0QYM6_PSEPJ|nr:hypothetical protein PPERSA_06981 [Pseudocohnilembus persalinus]|eukprot:KRX07366.1 hypothetical protein PPERSA_06981 [Pseudocohnilembus persalinus]